MERPAHLLSKLRLASALLIVPVVFGGCAEHQYMLKLTDGDQIISYTKPKLEGTNYHFMDAQGGPHVIPKQRVTKIQSVSVETPQQQQQPAPARPKTPKHWYFLWLA